MIRSSQLQNEEKVPFTAELRVENFEASLAYYKELLGFEIYRIHREGKFATLKLGNYLIMIMEEKGLPRKGQGFFFRMTVPDVDDYYEEVTKKGAKTLGPPEMRSWGAKRFYIEDPDGFRIQFISK